MKKKTIVLIETTQQRRDEEKKEKQRLTKEIRKETKIIRRKTKAAFDVDIAILVPKGILGSSFIGMIENKIKEAATILNIPESRVSLKRYSTYYSNVLTFYKCEEETNREYDQRIRKKVNFEIAIKKKIILKKEATERDKRKTEKKIKEKARKNAIVAIKLLGDDIYEVFKEINRF